MVSHELWSVPPIKSAVRLSYIYTSVPLTYLAQSTSHYAFSIRPQIVSYSTLLHVAVQSEDRSYISNFPNPNKEERTAYAKYWQDKLSDKPDLKFPDELVDSFAGKTGKFSFAYMKEAL